MPATTDNSAPPWHAWPVQTRAGRRYADATAATGEADALTAAPGYPDALSVDPADAGWGALTSGDALSSGDALDLGAGAMPIGPLAGPVTDVGIDPLRDTLAAGVTLALPWTGVASTTGSGGTTAPAAVRAADTAGGATGTSTGTSTGGSTSTSTGGRAGNATSGTARNSTSGTAGGRAGPAPGWQRQPPTGPQRYGAPSASRTGRNPSRTLPPVPDERVLAAAPPWVSRAVARAADRAARADGRRYGRPPAGGRYGEPPAASSWQPGGAPRQQLPSLDSQNAPPRWSRPATTRPGGVPGRRPRRRKVRLIWVLVVLFVLFFNTVSSCVHNQIDNIQRAPLPTYQAPGPQPGG